MQCKKTFITAFKSKYTIHIHIQAESIQLLFSRTSETDQICTQVYSAPRLIPAAEGSILFLSSDPCGISRVKVGAVGSKKWSLFTGRVDTHVCSHCYLQEGSSLPRTSGGSRDGGSHCPMLSPETDFSVDFWSWFETKAPNLDSRMHARCSFSMDSTTYT